MLSTIDIDRIIQMAWEDRTPFEAIKYQFNITEKEVIRLMKKEMTEKNWKKMEGKSSRKKNQTSSPKR